MNYFYVGLALASLAARAEPAAFESSENQTALIELYTSEGCSSCPPAESWLSQKKGAPGLWKDFVPVAFHVDYWDRLGWRDPWAGRQFSERQTAYAGARGAGSVYTPEFVLNGREWRDWSWRKTIPPPPNRAAGILRAGSEDGRNWKVSFAPSAGGGSYEANAALLDSDLSSDVTAGENQGRRLRHDFAVVILVKQPLAPVQGALRGVLTIAPGPNPKTVQGRPALAVWITRAGGFEPLQAVGGWLPEADRTKGGGSAGKQTSDGK